MKTFQVYSLVLACYNGAVFQGGAMLSGNLKKHVEDVDRQAEDMYSQLVDRMKQAEGITEQLKAADQMEWVRPMNSIRNRAEDIVINEIVYF